MSTPSRPSRTSRRWKAIGAGAGVVAACAVCCAGPPLALLAGVGAASALAALWIPALSILAVAALAGVVWVLLRRRRASACRTEPGVVELGMPSAAPVDAENDSVRT